MKYSISKDGTSLVVKVDGRLDAQTSPELQDAMAKQLEGVTDITFELADLEYISSAGLRILLASYKLMSKREGEMRIHNATGSVLRVLEMSGFASVFGLE